MDIKKGNVNFNKSGGTAAKGSFSCRITLPNSWLEEMGINVEEKKIVKIYDEKEKIIIIKKEEKN